MNKLESARLAGIDLYNAASELSAFAPLFQASELVTIVDTGMSDERISAPSMLTGLEAACI